MQGFNFLTFDHLPKCLLEDVLTLTFESIVLSWFHLEYRISIGKPSCFLCLNFYLLFRFRKRPRKFQHRKQFQRKTYRNNNENCKCKVFGSGPMNTAVLTASLTFLPVLVVLLVVLFVFIRKASFEWIVGTVLNYDNRKWREITVPP